MYYSPTSTAYNFTPPINFPQQPTFVNLGSRKLDYKETDELQRQQQELQHQIECLVLQFFLKRQFQPMQYHYPTCSNHRHSGPRCLDGSLDMRFKVNRGFSKYGN